MVLGEHRMLPKDPVSADFLHFSDHSGRELEGRCLASP